MAFLLSGAACGNCGGWGGFDCEDGEEGLDVGGGDFFVAGENHSAADVRWREVDDASVLSGVRGAGEDESAAVFLGKLGVISGVGVTVVFFGNQHEEVGEGMEIGLAVDVVGAGVGGFHFVGEKILMGEDHHVGIQFYRGKRREEANRELGVCEVKGAAFAEFLHLRRRKVKNVGMPFERF